VRSILAVRLDGVGDPLMTTLSETRPVSPIATTTLIDRLRHCAFDDTRLQFPLREAAQRAMLEKVVAAGMYPRRPWLIVHRAPPRPRDAIRMRSLPKRSARRSSISTRSRTRSTRGGRSRTACCRTMSIAGTA
jgi:hypothetical protein